MSENQKIGLGTVQFGTHYGISNEKGQTPPDVVSEILKIASENGIRILDTASAYGNAEQILGLNNLKKFSIVSKFMPPRDGESLRNQLDKTFSDLKIKRLYGYLAHRPAHLLENLHLWDELLELKQKKVISKAGFSLNTPEELYLLLEAGAVPDLVQLPYNYVDRRFESALQPLKDIGCEIHTRSAFLQGLFFKKREELSLFFDDIKPLISLLQNQVVNLAASLLAFVLENSLIDTVIIGVENSGQLLESITALEDAEPLPDYKGKISEQIVMPSNWPKE